MLHAKYQPSGSGEEVVWMVFTIIYMGMTAILNFRSSPVFAKSCITIM